MSLECSWFIVLQSDPHSPLFSILYLLPKDQTLKRVIKQLRSHLALLNTSHKDKQPNTKSVRLSVIPRIAQAPPDPVLARRPCSVETQEHSLLNMTTPIEVTRSKLPGDMAHMMPTQNMDPKEYRQVQRRKKDNVPRDLIGNAAWFEDPRQPEPGYILWRADKKGQQVIAHIEYIETEDAWFGLHYVKGIPYATIGSKIDEGKYGLKRKGGKTPNLYLWRNEPEPLSEEETPVQKPTILQESPPPTPEELETITQRMAAIPVQNQPMDDEDTLQYFTPGITAPIQINMAKAQDPADDDEEAKTTKGSLKGSPPAKFDGDRKMAKKFLNDFKTYKFLNRKNETMKVPANRVALALTFIKGEHVQDWAHEMMKIMEDQLES